MSNYHRRRHFARVQGRTTRRNLREVTERLDVLEVENYLRGFRLRQREEQLTRALDQTAELFVEVSDLRGELTNLSRQFSIRGDDFRDLYIEFILAMRRYERTLQQYRVMIRGLQDMTVEGVQQLQAEMEQLRRDFDHVSNQLRDRAEEYNFSFSFSTDFLS